jgi:glycosyltransferase involved in cell wall biosynthesis
VAEKTSYLLITRVPAHRIAPGRFAMESAFAVHLRALRRKLGPIAEDLVMAAPGMSAAQYDEQKSHLVVIDEGVEGIRLNTLFPADIGRLSYFLQLPGVWRDLFRMVKEASVVHASNSSLYRPFEFPGLLMGWALGAKTISVTDIDNRSSARMHLDAGRWSFKEYLVTRLLHDSYAHLQQVVGVRLFSLVLLKGRELVEDYGTGRSNVKNFLSPAFSKGQIIAPAALDAKLRALSDAGTPLVVTYFGRLVPYKGIDHMLRAFHAAQVGGAQNLRLRIIGGGPERNRLGALAEELRLGDRVAFEPPVSFDDIFEHIYRCHLLLATPLSQDTPRNALDAMASGQAVLAYDTAYYRELAVAGAGIELVPWLDIAGMARTIVELSRDRQRLVSQIRRGVEFARANTQELWLDRRVSWTEALFGDKGRRAGQRT